MKKKTLPLLLICAVTAIATGCGYSFSEKRQMKAYQKQAGKNAVSYISEKYGLDAEVTELDAESNWNGYGAIDAGQIVQAYALDTDASVVDVYIPAKSLHVKDRSKVVIGMQYDFEGEHHYKILNPKLSDDGVYIHAKVYARDYSDICFAPFVDAHDK